MEKVYLVSDTNEIIEWFKIILPVIITIIGFVVNFFVMRGSIRKEIESKKTNIYLNELSKIPYELILLMESMLKNVNNQKRTDKFIDLMAIIFSYGTKEAIKIAASMQEYNYTVQDSNKDGNKIMAYFILLTCQIKYDLTGIEINPESWYKIKLTDYGIVRENLDKVTNQIVKDLQLHRFMLIK